MKNGEVTIRSFKKEDSKEISRLLIEAFPKQFKIIRLKKPELINFLIDTHLVPTENSKGYMVAEMNEKLVGIIILNWKHLEKKQEKLNFEIIKKYGLFNAITAVLARIFLKPKLEKDECHIESITVDENYRKNGIGMKLLLGAIKTAKNEKLKKITLNVEVDNFPAIALYKKIGFKIINTEKSVWRKITAGGYLWNTLELKL